MGVQLPEQMGHHWWICDIEIDSTDSMHSCAVEKEIMYIRHTTLNKDFFWGGGAMPTITIPNHPNNGHLKSCTILILEEYNKSFWMAIKWQIISTPDWKSDGNDWQFSYSHLKTGQICPVFRCHSKSEPFDLRTSLDHSKTGLVRYSDVCCTVTIRIPEPI
jgi:hypothetical protein